MNFALGYVVQRVLYRFTDFFHHWYIDGTKVFVNKFILLLESLDQTFAVHVTLRHFFEPLYKDYSIIGRVLGVVFRTVRIGLGASIYLICFLVFLALLLMYLALPLTIIYYAITHFYKKS